MNVALNVQPLLAVAPVVGGDLIDVALGIGQRVTR